MAETHGARPQPTRQLSTCWSSPCLGRAPTQCAGGAPLTQSTSVATPASSLAASARRARLLARAVRGARWRAAGARRARRKAEARGAQGQAAGEPAERGVRLPFRFPDRREQQPRAEGGVPRQRRPDEASEPRVPNDYGAHLRAWRAPARHPRSRPPVDRASPHSVTFGRTSKTNCSRRVADGVTLLPPIGGTVTVPLHDCGLRNECMYTL